MFSKRRNMKRLILLTLIILIIFTGCKEVPPPDECTIPINEYKIYLIDGNEIVREFQLCYLDIVKESSPAGLIEIGSEDEIEIRTFIVCGSAVYIRGFDGIYDDLVLKEIKMKLEGTGFELMNDNIIPNRCGKEK